MILPQMILPHVLQIFVLCQTCYDTLLSSTILIQFYFVLVFFYLVMKGYVTIAYKKTS